MRSRTARVTFGAMVWLAIGGAAAFLIYSERHLTGERAALRSFDQHAHDATAALGALRAAQQAYVAEGQGIGYWMPKVSGLAGSVSESLMALAALATPAGRQSIEEARATVAEFATVDKRARDYVKNAQPLMAGDVIFTEGGQTTDAAAQQIEMARLSEHEAFDLREASARRLEGAVLGGAAILIVLVIALLVPRPGRAVESAASESASQSESPAGRGSGDLMLRVTPRAQAPPPSSAMSARSVSPILKAAADLCTEIGRVNSADELNALLGRAANLMDASGLIVWMGSTAGADLKPVLAHGYGAQALARMPTVPRSADNAAAAAYRGGMVQIVLTRPGSSTPGAIVAPLLGPDGCIGALSAEITGGGEASDAVQALASLFAAQITSVLVSPAQTTENRAAASL